MSTRYPAVLISGILLILLSSCSDKETVQIDYTFQVAKDVGFDADQFDQIQFTPGQNLDLGFYKGHVWIKLEVTNTEKPQSLVILGNDLINRWYRFYELDKSTNTLIPANAELDPAYSDHRTDNFPKPNFRIDLDAYEKGTYFISTTSDGRILQATPQLISLEKFLSVKQQFLIYDMVFYGSITILLLINLFYFQIIKSNIYYFYGAYIIASCIMYLFVEGRLYGLGLSHATIDHLMFVSIRVWIMTGILFALNFLGTRETNVRYYKFIIALLVLTLGVTTVYQFAFPNFSISTLHITENILGFIWIILSLTITAISYRKRKLESLYYLISYSALLSFITLGLIDSHTTMLPGDPFSYFKIGTIFEFIGFTYFIAILIKKKLRSSDQLEVQLAQTRLELGEKEKQLGVDRAIKKTDFASIFKLVESSLSTDAEWDEFKIRFEELQPNFYDSLVRKFPDLTKSEVRLLILVHIGYAQKEIAEILNIAPDSVKKGRTRARKKLNIPANVRLEEFLTQF